MRPKKYRVSQRSLEPRLLETTSVRIHVTTYDKDLDASHRAFFVGRVVNRNDFDRLSGEKCISDPMYLTV